MPCTRTPCRLGVRGSPLSPLLVGRPSIGDGTRRHVHYQHCHVVILLVACEHIVKQVLEQPPWRAQQVLGRARGNPDQFVEAGVNAAHPVLDQAV